jgi:hypothetical protein
MDDAVLALKQALKSKEASLHREKLIIRWRNRQ